MSEPKKALIHLVIEGDKFVATCPHVPSVRAEHTDDGKAVNAASAAVREHRRPYEAAGKPVPWVSEPEAPEKVDKTYQISGLWPAETIEPKKPAGSPKAKAKSNDPEPESEG